MTRIAALILAYFFLMLAIIGVFLPGIPTVPFLLLTAWFAARGSERLHRWLYAHPHLGKLLIEWETQRAISRGSKVVAVLMLALSWTLMYFKFKHMGLLLCFGLLFLVIGGYLVTRPEPK